MRTWGAIESDGWSRGLDKVGEAGVPAIHSGFGNGPADFPSAHRDRSSHKGARHPHAAGRVENPPALPAPQACSGGHTGVLSRFRQNLPIQLLKARVPQLGSSPFLREAPSTTHSKLRCVSVSFAVHHLRRRVVPLEACSSPARSPTSGTRRSEKITAREPKISASSEMGNSELRVPHVGPRVKCGGRRAVGVARLRLWNSEVAWVDALRCHEFMAMESGPKWQR